MAVTIKLTHGLKPNEESWLAKNVGRRLHYLHNSIGGEGWIAKQYNEQEIKEISDGERYTTHHRVWKLTLENESYASFFLIQFPQ